MNSQVFSRKGIVLDELWYLLVWNIPGCFTPRYFYHRVFAIALVLRHLANGEVFIIRGFFLMMRRQTEGRTEEDQNFEGKDNQKDKPKEEQRNKGIVEEKNRGTEEQRNKGQRNRGTEEQRNRGTNRTGFFFTGWANVYPANWRSLQTIFNLSIPKKT